MDKSEFILKLSKLRQSSTFLTLHNYKNEYGEVANYNIVFHISYENALKKSISIIENYLPSNNLEHVAKSELIDGYNKSLLKAQDIEIIDEYYHHIYDSDGKIIKGIKIHNENEELYIYGFIVNKSIIENGNYPVRNKRPLTIAKDNLRKLTPVDKFRQFKITQSKLNSISVENMEFHINENW